MDETLAQIIAKHLRAFLKVIRESPYGGFPGELCDRYGHEQGAKEWHNILRKMIYAFEEYKHRPNIELNDDLEEDEIDKEAEREREMTDDMHLIYPIHDLLMHMNFSIFDFLWVRDFNTEITVQIEKETHHIPQNEEELDWSKWDY